MHNNTVCWTQGQLLVLIPVNLLNKSEGMDKIGLAITMESVTYQIFILILLNSYKNIYLLTISRNTINY